MAYAEKADLSWHWSNWGDPMKASPLVLLLAWSGLLIDQPTLLAQEVQPSTWQAKYRSGRIDALKRQLASGNTSTDDGATARYRCVVSDRACPARRAVYLPVVT